MARFVAVGTPFVLSMASSLITVYLSSHGYTVHAAFVLIWAGFVMAAASLALSRHRDKVRTMRRAFIIEVCALVICAAGATNQGVVR